MRRNLNKKPIEQAKEAYERNNCDFNERLLWHSEEGFVISTPYIFAIGYFWKDKEELVCHVTYLCGSMDDLLRFNLFSIDKVEFERNFSGKTKMYDCEKLQKRIINVS